MNQNESKQSNVTHNQQQRLTTNKAGFDNPFINRRGFTFKYLQELKVRYQ